MVKNFLSDAEVPKKIEKSKEIIDFYKIDKKKEVANF